MNKRIPERKCIGCGTRRPKNELIRVVRLPDGTVTIDKTGKLSGRGAYLCPAVACYGKARKAKRLESNLAIDIPDELHEKLTALLASEQEDAHETKQ